MYLAVFPKPAPIMGAVFPPGEYLCENRNAGEFLAHDICTLKEATAAHTPRRFDPAQDWNGRRILFVRPGGFGDLLFLTPIFAEIKRRWPAAAIDVACFAKYTPALQGNPDVARLVPYPVNLSTWGDYDAHFWLQNVIEGNPKAEELHVVDLLAEEAGLTLAGKEMKYCPAPSELASAHRAYPRHVEGRPRVGIQVAASTPVRSYPPRLVGAVSAELLKKGWEVYLFGSPGQLLTELPVVNLTQRTPPVSFRESAALLATCDVCVAPDSALIHLAGAMNLPAVGLYGSFPWKLRTAYAPKTVALTGTLRCAPCFHHPIGPKMFPETGPCQRSRECDALAAIDPQRVVAKVESLLKA